jgi:cyanophycin synthetase
VHEDGARPFPIHRKSVSMRRAAFNSDILRRTGLRRGVHRLAVRLVVRPYIVGCRVPIVAVTGTNGKTTTTRLLEKIYLDAGYRVGSCSTYGVSHNGVKILDGDLSNARGAWEAAHCPDLDVLVLEVARGGLLSYGLGFRTCQVSVVTSLYEDHLGFDGIETLDAMAQLKALLPRHTARDGVVVLNGDNPRVAAMAGESRARPDYFVMESDLRQYDRAWFLSNGWIWRTLDGETRPVIGVDEIAITSGGVQRYNVANVMAVLGAVEGMKRFIPVQDAMVRRTLTEFGRNPYDHLSTFHLIRYRGETLLWMNAKNPASVWQEIDVVRTVLERYAFERCVGVLTAPGNRNEKFYRDQATLVEPVCDALVVHPPARRYLRGREGSSIVRLLSAPVPARKILSTESLTLDELITLPTKGAPGKTLFAVFCGCLEERMDVVRLLEHTHRDGMVASHF